MVESLIGVGRWTDDVHVVFGPVCEISLVSYVVLAYERVWKREHEAAFCLCNGANE